MNQFLLRTSAAVLLGSMTAFATAQDAAESLCVAPGLTILTDAAGDAAFQRTVPLPLDSADLLSVQVAQPSQADGIARLVFTIKVAGLSEPLPPVASWYTSFKSANGNFYGVRMNTDPMGEIAFQSYTLSGSLDAGDGAVSDGRFADVIKPADPLSNFNEDGTITVVVKSSDIGAAKGGELTQFNAGTVQRVGEESIGGAAFVLDGAPDDLSRIGAVSVTENTQCTAAAKSGLEKFGGTAGLALLLPLLMLAGLRRRQ